MLNDEGIGVSLPTYRKYLVIGAGIHGLSTAYHLALRLRAQGKGDGRDILMVDKSGIAAGASGIACGVVRNNYYQPAMRELMAHSVAVWESDPGAFSYHPVGYMQISPECMRRDVAGIAEQQAAIGYESVFIEGENATMNYMKGLFHDWQARGVTSVLHEKRGGYANNAQAVLGLAGKAEAEGVRILTGCTVNGFHADSGSQAIRAVQTDQGDIACEQVIVAVGPWVSRIWDMLELPATITVPDTAGARRAATPMWVYWSLQEGVLGVPPQVQKTNDGGLPPVIHVDSDAPLYSIRDGALITDQLWGIYYKPDTHFNGVQGGATPIKVQTRADRVAVDPYGVASPDFVVGDDFAHLWCSALAHCQQRFESTFALYRREPSGGIGCFTPDNFPVFDVLRENVYLIADSNHGYKMIGVGALVAEELLGQPSRLLHPFRFSRFAAGQLHPVSNSPFPWS